MSNKNNNQTILSDTMHKVTDRQFSCLDTYDLYNLYNEGSFIIDFGTKSNLHINLSIVVDDDYIEEIDDFSPDNLNHLVIIGSISLNLSEIIRTINSHYGFKNYHFFDEEGIQNMHDTFPIIFNGFGGTYPSFITPLLPKRVFLGSVKTVSEEFLHLNNIDRVINMCFSKLCLSIEKNFPIEDDDGVDISEILDKTFAIMDNTQNILVVCEKGKSRSASVVLYYYAKKYGLSLTKGLDGLKSCRSLCNPNKGFLNQIEQKLDTSV